MGSGNVLKPIAAFAFLLAAILSKPQHIQVSPRHQFATGSSFQPPV
jgi:hypothetical protein